MTDSASLPEAAASADARLAELIDELTSRLHAGEALDLDACRRAHPEHAERLEKLLPALRVLAGGEWLRGSGPVPHGPDPIVEFPGGRCGSGVGAVASPPSGPDTAHNDPPEPARGELGDFHLLREVGRGGMGVVYEAEQVSLRRRVALKVLPFAAALDARQLQRFKTEAQAAAHLHHTNIVPVYAIGCERGVHYYAMQFIDGRTLAALIGEFRRASDRSDEAPPARGGPPARTALGAETTGPAAAAPTAYSNRDPAFFRTAATLAVQAAEALAHAHSLGVVHRDVKPANLLIDGTGNLWVTDFGLAQVQADSRLTLTGDLVGTLRYMSPEQALAQTVGVDHRTDVYALGATLYELLTLEPAFDGRDRQELLRQIGVEEPRPPRRLNRAVPTELETIVLKAMAKNREERYRTAQELADDLRRFLKDEPILARRPTLVQRGRRWARRHRVVVWSATVGVLAALVVLACSVGWVVRDRAARRAKRVGELQAAVDEARRFQTAGRWPQARTAARRAETLLEEGAEPEVAGRVRGLLRELAEEEADGLLVAELEEIRLRQSEVDVREDRFALERALPEYRQAFRRYGLSADAVGPEGAAARLKRRPPAVHATLVAALDHWQILARYRKAPEAAWLERVLSLADSDPWRRRLRVARERNDRTAFEQLAREVEAVTQPPEELFLLDRGLRQRGASAGAVALMRRAQEAFPGDFWVNETLGIALANGPPPRYDEAVRFLTAAVALRPESAGARLNLGAALSAGGRLDEAIAAFRKAVDLNGEYATAHYNLGLTLARKGRFEEAEAALGRAGALKPDHAPSHYALGNVLRERGRPDEAAAAYRRAVAQNPMYAEAHCNLGWVLRQQGDFAAALSAFRQGHELGSQRPDWEYPSAGWVKECQRLGELADRLPSILAGELRPAGASEWAAFAQVCQAKKHYAAAARLWVDAFRADAQLADPEAGHRGAAACAAARAGSGQGADAARLDEQQRARWRHQALEWLRADLTEYASRLEAGSPADRRLICRRLRGWWDEPALAVLRDPAAVSHLPGDEQTACKRLWAEVRSVLTKAEATE